MDYKKQVPDNLLFKAYFDKEAKEEAKKERAEENEETKKDFQKFIQDQLNPVKDEKEALQEMIEKQQKRIKELEAQLQVKEESIGNVRIQYQILHYLYGLEPIIEARGTLEEKGEFLSYLFNRNAQRARKPLSSLRNLVYSSNEGEAVNIKRDLIKVKRLFKLLGLEAAKRVQEDLDKLK